MVSEGRRKALKRYRARNKAKHRTYMRDYCFIDYLKGTTNGQG